MLNLTKTDSMLTVNDIIRSKSNEIFSVLPGSTVYEAIRLMGEKNIGAVLVMEAGSLKGILSERDYARKIVLKDRRSRETMVSDIMTEKVITVSPADSVEHCMSTMTARKIRHLPVTENENVVGMISIGDVVMAVINMQKETIDHLQNYISQ
jgi:CBS domain-containing protein